MKFTAQIVLLVAAFICFLVRFILDAFGGSSGKINLMALGATFFVAAFIFT